MAKYIYILWSKNHSVYVFGTIFLVQSNQCEALFVWVQQCLLQVKGHEYVSISFLFYGSICDAHHLQSNIVCWGDEWNGNVAEWIRQVPVDLPRMFAFGWSGSGNICRAGVLASLGVGTLWVRNVSTETACLLIVYAAHDVYISFIYCLRTPVTFYDFFTMGITD